MTIQCEDCGFVDDTCTIILESTNVRGTASKYGNIVCRKCKSKNIKNVDT